MLYLIALASTQKSCCWGVNGIIRSPGKTWDYVSVLALYNTDISGRGMTSYIHLSEHSLRVVLTFSSKCKQQTTVLPEMLNYSHPADIYLSPVVLEHNHAGLWIHPLQDQRLPIPVSTGNHGGHRGDRITRGLNHVIGRRRRTFLTACWVQP